MEAFNRAGDWRHAHYAEGWKKIWEAESKIKLAKNKFDEFRKITNAELTPIEPKEGR